MDERLHLLGIRHHGPGSAALVLKALDELDPQAVLIEGSPEAESLIPYAGLPGMRPPVALLSYAIEQPRLAVFSPFADYSPEWQAMRWALAKGRPIRFIDWPVSASLAAIDPIDETESDEDNEWTDPLDLLARAAGFTDGETFWNAIIEQQAGEHRNPLAVFRALETALSEARGWQESHQPLPSSRANREAWREAHMRINLRQALQDHQGAIAAIVGAWHLGGLRANTTQTADKALIKGLPTVKCATLWVPWTNGRLTAASGYGAGVISPGWYQHLWSLYSQPDTLSPEKFVAQWQSKTASILRHEGYAASTASALEAARLTIALSALRGLATPGLPEMREAALSVLCQGEETPMAIIEEKLYIGESLGAVDPSIPQTPLFDDLVAWQRKTRLQAKADPDEISLDLRSDAGLLKSTLLHRLNIIGLDWGRLIDAEAGRGTFREIWRLQWQPEFAVALAEALVYGVTIEQAAAGKAREQAEAATGISELADLVRATLTADLPATAAQVIDRLRRCALVTSDMNGLMSAVPPLVQIQRYGTARKLPETELNALIHSLSVEINAGFRLSSYQLDASAAGDRATAMGGYHQALLLLGNADLSGEWLRQLALLVHDEQAAAALAGLGLRCLFDTGHWTEETVGQTFSWHLSGHEPAHSGAFLEYFIGENAEILLNSLPLLRLVDNWLHDLGDDDFLAALPMLRRSFSNFQLPARRRLFQALSREESQTSSIDQQGMSENPAFSAALPLLYQILGVKK